MPREQHTFDFGDRLSAGGLRASLGEKLRTSSINEGCQQSNYDDGIEEVNSVFGHPPFPFLVNGGTMIGMRRLTVLRALLHSTVGIRSRVTAFQALYRYHTFSYGPNQDITTDFDDLVPYVYRDSQGQAIHGNIIPPPGWRDSPVYRAALNNGVAYRDGSWITIHNEDPIFEHRDFDVRPQLLVQLVEHARRVWRDRIPAFFAIRVHLVRPTPMDDPADPPGTRLLHLVVEVRRPFTSYLNPVLIAARQISATGVSNPQWMPLLLPLAIDTAMVLQRTAIPCSLHHLLVPLPGRVSKVDEPIPPKGYLPRALPSDLVGHAAAAGTTSIHIRKKEMNNNCCRYPRAPLWLQLGRVPTLTPMDLHLRSAGYKINHLQEGFSRSLRGTLKPFQDRHQQPPRIPDDIATGTFMLNRDFLAAHGVDPQLPQEVDTYGLYVQHIEKRSVRLPDLSTQSILGEIRRLWADIHHPFTAILARPPAEVPTTVHFIVEFLDFHRMPIPGTTPVLRRIFDAEIGEPQIKYLPTM